MQRIIAVIFFAIIFSSCANKSQHDLAVLKAAQEGFEQSNKTILYSTERIYHALQQKLSMPETAQQASIWQPKATVISESTKKIINYISELIKKLQEDEKTDAVNNLFFNEKKGDELYNKLQKYKQYILNVDPQILNQFGKDAIIITQEFESDSNKTKDFTKTFFYQQPTISVLAMLRKFENNVRVLENELVTFCFNKIGMLDGPSFFTQTGVLVSQSTNYIKGGDNLQIMAGVGSFSAQAKPEFTINGKVIPFDNLQGFVEYKFKTPLKAGKYYVAVNIKFTDERGQKQSMNETVEYTVVE